MAKKPVAKLTKSMEKKIAGDMPANKILDKIATSYAHSYMSRYFEYSDAMEYLTEYLSSKELKKKLSKIPKYTIPQTAGWIAKYLQNGCTVTPESMEYLNNAIKMIEDFELVEEKKLSSSNAIKTYENNQIIMLEAILDQILKGEAPAFNATNHFKANETGTTDLKAIKEYYDGMAEQLQDKKNKEYFNHSPSVTKSLIAFYKDIVSSVDIILNNKVRERKPRTVKAKPAAKLVSKLRFMKESNELKVSSLAVEKVVSSDQLLVFNTKYNVLTMLYALPGKKFTAHRTAIMEIDPERSVQKTLRKPEVNISKFTVGSKTSINKEFKALKTVEKKVETFLTNENLLLLRAF